MIRFLDGPASGVTLTLRRAPIFLRVVTKDGTNWDALDEKGDEWRHGERVYVYILQDRPTAVHMKCARKADSGFYAAGEYRHLDEEIAPGTLRDNESWTLWCRDHADRLMPEWAKALGVRL